MTRALQIKIANSPSGSGGGPPPRVRAANTVTGLAGSGAHRGLYLTPGPKGGMEVILKEFKNTIYKALEDAEKQNTRDGQTRAWTLKWVLDELKKVNKEEPKLEVEKYETNKMVEINIDEVKKYLAPKATDQELYLFVNIARAYGLNPFKREIHFIKYGDQKASIVVGYEIYLKRAEATGKLDGWKVWIDKDQNGEKAVIEIRRKDWKEPFTWEVYRKEFDQRQANWNRMPTFMLKKVAIAQGFRMAFPDEMGGMPYIPEEINEKTSEDLEPPPELSSPEPQSHNVNAFYEVMEKERKRLGDKKFMMILGNNGFERIDEIKKRQDQVRIYKIMANYPSTDQEQLPVI